MKKTVPLRYLADLNPAVPEFDALGADSLVGFLPLEAVWSDGRADHARSAPRVQVASGYTRYRVGDVLVPKVTPTFQAGRAMIATKVGAGSTELHVLRPRTGIDSRWLAYAARSKRFLTEGVSAFEGVAGLQRVPAEFVEAFRVTDVCPGEQRRIADFLDDRVSRIDRIIAARREQSLLIGKTYEAWLNENIESLGARYGWLPLRRLSPKIEQGWSPVADSVPAVPGQPGVLKIGAVRGGSFRPGENKGFLERVEPNPDYKITVGDLLVTRANTPALVGDVAVVDELPGGASHLYLSDLIYRVDLRGVDVRFISAALRTPRVRQEIGIVARGSSGSMPKLRGDDLSSLSVPYVPAKVQRDVGNLDVEQRILRDKRSRNLLDSIDLLTEYKSSLITAAVTGQLDVTTAGSTIPE